MTHRQRSRCGSRPPSTPDAAAPKTDSPPGNSSLPPVDDSRSRIRPGSHHRSSHPPPRRVRSPRAAMPPCSMAPAARPMTSTSRRRWPVQTFSGCPTRCANSRPEFVSTTSTMRCPSTAQRNRYAAYRCSTFALRVETLDITFAPAGFPDGYTALRPGAHLHGREPDHPGRRTSTTSSSRRKPRRDPKTLTHSQSSSRSPEPTNRRRSAV